MMNLQELQANISSLPYEQFIELSAWFAEKDWDIWDRKLEQDVESGKLDFLFEEAMVAKGNRTLRDL